MRVWIKYASVSFKAAETCQDCHLFSDSIAVKWQFKSGGLSLSWQVFNLCSISAHCRELFSIHCFLVRLSSQWLCCFPAPSSFFFFLFYAVTSFFSLQSPAIISSCRSIPRLEAHKQLTLAVWSPASVGRDDTCSACFSLILPSFQRLPPPQPPQASRSFLCSWHLFCWWLIEMSMWGEGP